MLACTTLGDFGGGADVIAVKPTGAPNAASGPGDHASSCASHVASSPPNTGCLHGALPRCTYLRGGVIGTSRVCIGPPNCASVFLYWMAADPTVKVAVGAPVRPPALNTTDPSDGAGAVKSMFVRTSSFGPP